MNKIEVNNIIINNKNGIEYLQFKKLMEYNNIVHCYTLKHDLNFKSTSPIKNQSIEKICSTLGIDRKEYVRANQDHTNNIQIVNDIKISEDDTDALITNKKNIALATTSADCISLLMFDYEKNVIAAVHSGWRGTVKKIARDVVEKMIEVYNCNASNIICCICPSIRKCHFEVDYDVKEIFAKTFNYEGIIEKGVIRESKQKYNIDTVEINKRMIKEIGIKEENIIDSKLCTVCNSDKFHSYRKDRPNYGLNVAIIELK